MTIIEYIEDPRRFRKAFKDLGTWTAWLTFLRTLYGLPLQEEDELTRYRHFSGRTTPPTEPFEECWLACGRRAGKSFIASVIAVYEALEGNWKLRLSGGETPWIFIVAVDKAQASLIFSYVRHLLQISGPHQIQRETSDQIDLKNGVSISIRAGSLRSLRGYSIALALIDEAAFLRDQEGGFANPLQELVNAIEPALIQRDGDEPAAKLIGLSTPFSRFGLLYERITECWGNDAADILAWKGTTLELNPTFSQYKIERALRKDPARARAEYLGEFREDVSNLMDEKLLASAMADHQPQGYDPARRYAAFIDPSSGKSDSYCLAIGFQDPYSRQIVVVRQEERRAPCDVAKVTEEFARIIKAYGLSSATSDTHASGWVESEYRKHGVQIDITKLSKSDIYLEFVGLLATGRLWLVADDRARQQFLGLERRLEKSGIERVDHAPYGGPGDDLANVIAGVSTILAQERGVWTAEEVEARMPVKQHGSPEGRRRESAEALEKELRDWMSQGLGGLSRIVRK
jgi:hypothetical protein